MECKEVLLSKMKINESTGKGLRVFVFIFIFSKEGETFRGRGLFRIV